MKDILGLVCLAMALLVGAFLLLFGWAVLSALWRPLTQGKAVFRQPVAKLVARWTGGACVWLAGGCLLAFLAALAAGVGGLTELSAWWMGIGGTAGANLILIAVVGASLAISVHTAHLGVRRMRLAKSYRGMQRSYGAAVAVWSAAGAVVGAALGVAAQEAVRRLLARTDVCLFPSLLLPDATHALARSLLYVAFWPVACSGAFLDWYGYRLPPLEPDAG